MKVRFVDVIPRADDIDEDFLYISVKYNMTAHRCACGCGVLVPLPISPDDWVLTYDGVHVSLSPSVGNGSLECRSHYYIRDSQVIWLPKMSTAQSTTGPDALYEQPQNKRHSSSKRYSYNVIAEIVRRFRRIINKL